MEKLKFLNRNQIKYAAVLAMIIDHIAWAFVPTKTPLGVGMHFIGRLTGPTMAYFLGEGFLHTRSRTRYALRLVVFALVSWIPYSLFEEQSWPTPELPVTYTLLLGFAVLWTWNSEGVNRVSKVAALFGALVLSTWGDWSYMGVLLPVLVVKYKDNERARWLSFAIACAAWALVGFSGGLCDGLYNLGTLVPPLLLGFFYSGERGSSGRFHKWSFYIFYPTHLLVLALLRYGTVQIFDKQVVFPWQ